MKGKEIPNINQSVTLRTSNKEGQTFLIEVRNWICASQFCSFPLNTSYTSLLQHFFILYQTNSFSTKHISRLVASIFLYIIFFFLEKPSDICCCDNFCTLHDAFLFSSKHILLLRHFFTICFSFFFCCSKVFNPFGCISIKVSGKVKNLDRFGL